jgi:hypothetical protein
MIRTHHRGSINRGSINTETDTFAQVELAFVSQAMVARFPMRPDSRVQSLILARYRSDRFVSTLTDSA